MGRLDLAVFDFLLRLLLGLVEELSERLYLVQEFLSLSNPLAAGLDIPIPLPLDLELLFKVLVLILVLPQEVLHDLQVTFEAVVLLL